MKTIKSVFILAFIILEWMAPAHAAINIALDKPVTLIGEFGTGSGYLDPNNLPPLPPASIVTDGVFEDGSWTNGVWWDEQYSGTRSMVAIDLLGSFSLNTFSVMADNNDVYLLEYRDPSGNWVPAWEIPEVCCFGLTERTTMLSSPVTATALRLSAFPPTHSGMDYAFSVSEIQAALTLVPEPESYALMLAGLLLLAIRHNKYRPKSMD